MTEGDFWALIEESIPSNRVDFEAQLENMESLLSELTPEEIVSFEAHFHRKRVEAYDFELWGAAYLINGGCSDDGFEYFRWWLISRGRKAYEAARQNPDSLADLPDTHEEVAEFEDFGYVAQRVYKLKAGCDFPEQHWVFPSEPRGVHWDFDDTALCLQHFPKLAAAFC